MEGHRARSFTCFIGHARGSLLEIETQLEIARDLGYLAAADAAQLLARASEVARMVNGLRAWSESEVGARAADS